MKPFAFRYKRRTNLFRTKRDHIVEIHKELWRQFVCRFRIVPRNIDTNLFHNGDSIGIQLAREGTRTLNLRLWKDLDEPALPQADSELNWQRT